MKAEKREITGLYKEIKNIIDSEMGIDISINRRRRDYVYGRCLFYKIVKEIEPDMSYASIGSFFHKDHASVLYSINRTFHYAMQDLFYRDIYNKLQFCSVQDSESKNLLSKYKEVKDLLRAIELKDEIIITLRTQLDAFKKMEFATNKKKYT